jgi:hypothetical protein
LRDNRIEELLPLVLPSQLLLHKDRDKTRECHLEVARKRGPKTAHTDEELTALIRADLDGSPFVGEGHRKVW